MTSTALWRPSSVSSRWRSGSTVSRPCFSHEAHGLGNGRAGVLKSFSDARTHGDNTLFSSSRMVRKYICGIDEVCHISLPAITATVLDSTA